MLCVLLTFVYPATTLYGILSRTIPSLIGNHSADHAILLGVYIVAFVATAVFSFSAGWKLWLIKPGAVRFARRYLLTYLAAHVAYFVFWMLMVRPTHIASFAQMGWSHLVGPIPSVALWYFYLEHSKQVRATYPLG